MEKKNQFSITDGALVPFNSKPPIVVPLPGCTPIFVEWKPGEFYFMGHRKIQYVKATPDGWSGWTHVHSEQVKANGASVTYLGQQMEVGIVPYVFKTYPFPYPLESKADSALVESKGFNGKKTAKQWAAALNWKGVGSARAAVEVRNRWSNLQNGMRTLAPCPHVTFPPSEKEPALVDLVERLETELDGLRGQVERLETKNAELQARIELLEFIP